MLDDFNKWLGATPVSLVIQKVFWIIPTVQIVHILAISAVLASMAMFDLRLLGLAGKRNSIASFSTAQGPAMIARLDPPMVP